MPEEFDFSELRNYLQGQIDMGFADVETRNDQFNKQRMIKAVRQ